MSASNSTQGDQETPQPTASSAPPRVEEIDEAQAGESDSWETDDEGDFYSEQANGEEPEEDEEGFVDIGLSKQLIECYPTTTAEAASAVGALCDICLNEYKSDDHLRTIPCLHRFHCKCIDKWLRKNSKCPMCRSDLRRAHWYPD